MNGDALVHWFTTAGYCVTPHYWCNTAIQLGWQFVHKGCELSWRCEQQRQRVWIVMLRHRLRQPGLANPFASLYLLAQAVTEVYGPEYALYGNVNVMSHSELSEQRLARFYRRWTGATEIEAGWFCLETGKVCSLRSRRIQKNVHH